jgi:hypothetical protein
MIQSEFKHLIGAKVVMLKCRVFGGKTGTIATVQVFVWSDPLQRFGSRSELDPELTREFATIANTTHLLQLHHHTD